MKKKKITITAIKKAVQQHYGLNELIKVNQTEKTITFARGSHALIKFEIFGINNEFVGWVVEGYTNYVMAEWLNDILKCLEGDN